MASQRETFLKLRLNFPWHFNNNNRFQVSESLEVLRDAIANNEKKRDHWKNQKEIHERYGVCPPQS